MLEGIRSFVRKGIRTARRFFTDKPEDSFTLHNDQIAYTTDGCTGSCHARELKHVSLEESFLGLFGTTFAVRLKDDTRLLIRGLEDKDAKSLMQQANDAILRIAVADARKNLAKSGRRIEKAWSALSCDYYISAWQMAQWAEEYGDLKFLVVLEESIVRAADAVVTVLECRRVLMEPEAWRIQRNDRWVAQELMRQKTVLDSISKVPLTDKQREAIIRHDNRVLAVAGAGTGKTTTVVGKVAYLLDTKWCRPEEILLLSFSRGAVEELKARVIAVCGDKVQVRTFHSLGLEIITKATGQKPAVFEQDLIARIIMYLEDMLNQQDSQGEKLNLLSFLAYHFFPSKTEHEFETGAEYLRYVSGNDIRTLKDEKVRSNQEAQIANWLYLRQRNKLLSEGQVP